MNSNIQTDTNANILYRKWSTPDPETIVLLIHGIGAHSFRWLPMAEYLANNNISSYAIELKGFGETKELKGHIDSFGTYYKDIATLADIIRVENPLKKIFLIGESMGGLIAYNAANLHPEMIDGLICISPAFLNRMKISILGYLKIFLPLLYNPRNIVKLPIDSGMITKDETYREKIEADPLETRTVTSNLLKELVVAQVKAITGKPKFAEDILFLLAGKDKVVDTGTSEKIFSKQIPSNKKLIEYPEMYHALSIDMNRDAVFKDIVDWLNIRKEP
jgi:acylglycerol lipase